jgi:TolB-like protein/tetratricopeptide (TPR) repeat protein
MSHTVRFDCFEADLEVGQLRKRGFRIRLRDQPFQVLATLLEHPGEVVTRDDLRQRLWHDEVFVDFENSLNIAIARLRTALGDSVSHPRFIETLPKKGYRFVGHLLPSPQMKAEANVEQKRRLLVLPFMNLTGDSSQEYFSDAITDEIITALVSMAADRLAVIARTTAFHYKGSRKDVTRIGRELGLNYILEGSVRLFEEQVAVNVQLIKTDDQTHLFAKNYEAPLHDIFHLQNSIAQQVAAHIPFVGNEIHGAPVVAKPTEDFFAYTEYMKGRYEMWKGTPEGMAKAKLHFETALAHDHRFALACDGLANLHWYLGYWGFLPPDQAEPIRRFYALRAIELNPKLIETRCLAAFHPEKCTYADAYSYNWAETSEEMAHVRDSNPHSPLIRIRYATVLMVLGRNDEAIAELQHALKSDPMSIEVLFWLTQAFLYRRCYEQALEHARKLLDFQPENPVGSMLVGHVFLGMQRFDDSVAALRRAVEISREFPLMSGWLGLAFGLGGYTEEARIVLKRLQRISRNGCVLPTSFAWVYLGLGEIDKAFKWMELAVERIDGWIAALKSYPFLDPFRADPRFRALLCKLNLES